MFLSLALTVSLAAFLVGGPVADIQQQCVAEHDGVSDGSEPPGTWLGRGNPPVDARAVGSDYVAIPPESLQPPAAKTPWIGGPSAVESTRVRMAARWRATPVRGPPSSTLDCLHAAPRLNC